MQKALNFKLPDQDGRLHSLNDYTGKWLVLYFYPKDESSGCTTEACSFRDAGDIIAELGNCEVVGISTDTAQSHKEFIDNHNLNFTLLSDPSHQVIESYGSWGIKKYMGKEYVGTFRNTYIIDPLGNIAKSYKSVDPATHVNQLLNDLRDLRSSFQAPDPTEQV